MPFICRNGKTHEEECDCKKYKHIPDNEHPVDCFCVECLGYGC